MQRPTRHGLRAFALATSLLPLINCVDTPEPDTDVDEAELNGSFTDASPFQLQRAVARKADGQNATCTGTKIAPHWILTAGRCSFPIAGNVTYYGTSSPGTGIPYLLTAKVVGKIQPSGANAPSDTTDDYGRYADIALVQVDREDQFGANAALAYRYPGANVAGQKVGAGLTGDNDANNVHAILHQVGDTTSWSTDGSGEFQTTYRRWNAGDQGGPFYVNGRVLGVLDESSGTNARYTSVAAHLDWILEKTQYRWSGAAPRPGGLSGTTLESFPSDYRPCQYACDSRSDCEAFTYTSSSGTCKLLWGVTGTGSAPSGSISAVHYAGTRTSRTGDVVGLGESWFHVTSAGNIKQVSNVYGPYNTISTTVTGPGAPQVTGKLSVYQRADGYTSVLYRSITKLIEVVKMQGGWTAFEMPQMPNTFIGGDPAGYVKADGVSAVVYRTWDNHLMELTLLGGDVVGGWAKRDLTASIPGAPIPSSDPVAFVRADGYSSVVYRCGSSICEVFQNKDTHRWDWGQPLALAPGGSSITAVGKPSAYSHRDGITAITLRTTANQIKELWLDGLGWHVGDIMGPSGQRGPLASGDPLGYVRTDGIEAVVYRSGTQIWELANTTQWAAGNLSSFDSATAAYSDPVPFTRSDGRDSVPFTTTSTTIGELQLMNGNPAGWTFMNLSYEAFEQP